MRKNKVSALMLTLLLISGVFFSVTPLTDAQAAAFTPRLSAPASNNKYYFSDLNVFYRYGYGMPNCTAYAYGRAYELLGKAPVLCPYNAGEWYTYNKNNGAYAYGSTPKLGAIAVWDNYDFDTGHVAVVEKITGTQVTLSESAWGGSTFFTSEVSTTDSHLGYSRMRFLGYIYVGDFIAPGEDGNPVTTQTPGELWKINSGDGVCLRTGTGTGYTVVTTIPNHKTVRVSDKKTAEGYTWGKVSYEGKSGWCVLSYANKIGMIGDLNNDGKADLSDVNVLQKHIAKSITLKGNTVLLADTSGNGLVGAEDIIRLQKYISKQITTLA